MTNLPKNAIPENAREHAQAVGDTLDADILLFNAGITRKHQQRLYNLLEQRSRRKNILFFLLTEGGDPDAAYKISRVLQQYYERFSCFVTGYCKSAGTLILLGANELVMTDDGELGPVDIQMSKKDELAEYQSGLTVLSALTALHEKAYLAWEHFFLELEKGSSGSITLKTAAHIASELTTGLFSPVYQQIDPLQLGEAVRAMSIGHEYGKRLNRFSKNLRPNALELLVSKYPDHGFVIDRAEAETLFTNVRRATEQELILSTSLTTLCDVEIGRKSPIILFLNEEKAGPQGDSDDKARDESNVDEREPGSKTIASVTRGIISSNGN